MLSDLDSGLAVIGVVASWYGLKALAHLYKTFLRPARDLKKLGEWAVITGATDGIGKAYAFAMAKKGLNVMLISRTEGKLIDVKKEIEEKVNNVTISFVVCDFSKFDKAAKDKVAKAVQQLNVAVLINNVGLSYRYPLYFHELSDTEVQDLLTMNVDSAVWMTRMVLPGMIESKTGGAIVNLSSGSAMYTLPLLAEYSACKSFLEKFSRALNAEYGGGKYKISCQCQIPFYVSTKLAKMRPSMMVPTPQAYVADAMRWVGQPGDAVASPYLLHAVQGWVLDMLPDFVVSKIIMDMHLATRSRGKKKDARLAEEGAAKKD